MTRRAISSEQKRAAVSLAAVVGAEEAARQLGYDRRSVRTWSEQFGKRPELDAPTDELQDLYDLAVRKVTADVATGRIKGSALMTVLGVARDKLDRARRWAAQAPADGSGSAVAAHDEFHAWLADTIDTIATEPIEDDEALEATLDAIAAIVPELLLRRANAEADRYGPPSAHRVAVLAWFSKRREIEAGDVLEWAKATVLEVVAEHGSITAWHRHLQAEDEAERVRQEAEHARIRAKAEALKAESLQAGLDSETRSILAAAEAFLRESSDA